MRQKTGIEELENLSISLAKKIRLEIEQAGLQISNYAAVAHYFGIQFEYEDLPTGEEALYIKAKRKIVLSNQLSSPERANFSFCHEIMHDRIEHDDELLSLYADAGIKPDADYSTMERLCNTGAAELLMPSDIIRDAITSREFCTALIPEFCERFSASSISVAFQMMRYAGHHCYLVIAEQRLVPPSLILGQRPLLFPVPKDTVIGCLMVIYTAASKTARYSIKREQPLPFDHWLYDVLRTSDHIRGEAILPFASGKGWGVPCDALLYRGKVFAFFHVDQPVSKDQMSLF